jgi:hypothetical protein
MARDQGACSVSRRSLCRVSVGVLVAPGIGMAQISTVRRIGLPSGGPHVNSASKSTGPGPAR